MTQPDDVMEALIVLIRQRREKGIATYGKTLTAETPVDLRLYALEEALDLSAYLLAETKRLESAVWAREQALREAAFWLRSMADKIGIGFQCLETIDALLPPEKDA